MARRAWIRVCGVGAAVGVAGLVLVAACTQLIGVEGIPANVPDAGSKDANRIPDAAADHRIDARDAGPTCEAAADGGCVVPCSPGAHRCTTDGLGSQTCTKGQWGPVTLCTEDTPVCLGSACTCEPGAGHCGGPEWQQWQKCLPADAGLLKWQDQGDACAGTCTLTGCGPTPPSCSVDAGVGVQSCNGPVDGGPPESCCTSNGLPGGSFDRSYDNHSTGWRNPAFKASVSAVRLDRFEVTLGRFRGFFAALTGSDAGVDGGNGWRPAAGSGKHTHLNGGQGLLDRSSGAYERGWLPAWNAHLSSIESQLACGGTWDTSNTPADAPISCVTWPVAYAFCIWDGGFLPSEAEWNFAAAGGDEQRIYPWSVGGSMDAGISCANANYVVASACSGQPFSVGTASPAGDGKWGHADLAGNVLEWTLDVYNLSYAVPCVDCAYLPPDAADGGVTLRVQRGGAFVSTASKVLASYRGFNPELATSFVAGFRCARTP